MIVTFSLPYEITGIFKLLKGCFYGIKSIFSKRD